MALFALLSNLTVPACIAAVMFWLCKKLMERTSLPPGPIGLPFVGYLPYLFEGKKKHIVLDRLSKKYGSIFQFQAGENRFIVLNSASAMKAAFKLAEFQYRPETLVGRAVLDAGERNITFANGERWRFCRKLANRALPVFTVAKNSRLEPNLYECADWLCNKFLSECANGQSVQTKQYVMSFSGSLISSIIFGNAPEPEGEFVKWLGDFGTDFFNASQKVWLAEIFPTLKPLFKQHTDKMLACMIHFVAHVREMMREHEYTGDVATVSDSIIKACEELPAQEKAQMGITDDDIRDSVLELFDAGFFTTAENVEWLLLLLATHPSVTDKVHREIDMLIAENGKPTIKDDLQNMHYCRATVAETLRWTSNLPIGLPHTCLEDVKFSGYVIPKGSFILSNQYAINHDPELFDEPDKFKPERFIREDGTFNQEESEKMVSFSNGKRRCPGEQLAKQDIFLFLVYVMSRLDVRLDMTSFETNPLLGEGNGLTLFAGQHKLFFKTRLQQ